MPVCQWPVMPAVAPLPPGGAGYTLSKRTASCVRTAGSPQHAAAAQANATPNKRPEPPVMSDVFLMYSCFFSTFCLFFVNGFDVFRYLDQIFDEQGGVRAAQTTHHPFIAMYPHRPFIAQLGIIRLCGREGQAHYAGTGATVVSLCSCAHKAKRTTVVSL